jgi:uncharacterized HhH-GPD family protein
MTLHLTGDPKADDLLTRDPLALLIGMLLDQRIPMEKAFGGPRVLGERLRTDPLDAHVIAAADPEEFVAVMAGPPAVHRFPRSMAGRVQSLAAAVVRDYEGNAAALWRDAESGAALLARVRALPGFGDQKARIFTALLGKQLGVRPPGWQQAAGDYGLDGYRSAADVVDEGSLQRVREYKKAAKAAAAG